MTKLEELINELCPDGVEYVPIKEITKFEQPTKYIVKSTNYRDDFNTPVLTAGQTFILGYTNETDGIYNASKEHPVIIFDDFTGAFKWVDFPFKVKSSAMKMISANKDVTTLRYIYHVMGHLNFISSEHKRLWIGIYSAFRVPLPPLSIQSEIVHILDSFTLLTADLTADLTAELTARQKQYAFYRDYLLDFSNEDVTKKIPDIDCSNVEYKRLGDIATAIYRGAGIKRDEVTETCIPCVRYGEIYTTYNVTFNNCVSHTDEDKIQYKKYFEHGDVLFAITGESVEEIAKSCVYLGHDKCLAGGDIVVLKHNQNPKYMAYVLSTTNAQSQKSKGKVKSKVVHSSVPAISDIIIPIPPLAEQEKIANMIERFDHLCNDISNGLPAEIEARKKQYEYYRDTLLSFDDKVCSQIVKVERERANTH